MGLLESRRQLTRALATLLLLCVLALLSTVWLAAQSQQEAALINLAGRQRALIERMHRLLLQLDAHPAQLGDERLVQLDAARTLFHHTLQAFVYGGSTTDQQGQPVDLPAQTQPQLQEPLRRALTRWNAYEVRLRALAPVHTFAPSPVTVHETLEFADENSEALFTAMDALTTGAVLAHIHLVQQDRWLVAVALLLVLLSGGWLVRGKRRLEHDVVDDAAQAAQRVAQAQQAQRASELRLLDSLRASPDRVWVKDIKGTYTFCNAALAQSLGLEEREVVGKSDADLYDPERARTHRISDLAVRETGASTVVQEWQSPTRQGQRRLVEITKTPLRDLLGVFCGVQGVARDITDRRQAEVALRESRQRLDLLENCINHISDVVLITEAEPLVSPGPRIVFVNDAFERMTGYSREEALGNTPRMLQGPDTDGVTLMRLDDALKRWTQARVEVLNYRKSGEAFWVELIISPVANAQGLYTHWVAVQRDITAQKLNALQTQQLLARAGESATLRSEFLDRLTRHASTPINGVVGLTRMLLESSLDERQARYASNVLDHALELQAVFDRVRDFRAIELGNLVVESQPYELRAVLEQCRRAYVTQAGIKGLTLAVGVDASVPAFVQGDALRVQQVLEHLVENALAQTERGGIKLTARLHLKADARWIHLQVADTGAGFSTEQQAVLFQSEPSPAGAGDGHASLDVVLFRRLVALMGGVCGLESAPGQGSSFWFELALPGEPGDATHELPTVQGRL